MLKTLVRMFTLDIFPAIVLAWNSENFRIVVSLTTFSISMVGPIYEQHDIL